MKCEYLMEHSPKSDFFCIRTWLFPVPVLLVLFFAVEAQAQMFSVDSTPGRVDIPRTAIHLGLEPADFDYTGGDLPAGAGEEGRFAFSGSLIRLEAQFQGLGVSLASGGSLTGIDDVSYFDAGIQAGYGIPVVRSENLIIQIPLQVSSGITNVSSDRGLSGSSQFRQGSLTVGAGGFIGVRPSGRLRMQAGFIPNYGFSFATGGTFGGSLGKLEGKFRLFFDRLFGETGLSLGYNYKFNRFDIDENEFDYDLQAHTILVGITF